MVNNLVRKLARVMAGWPLIGRVVRIGIAVIRLPELNHHQHMFETQQLPRLLHTFSDLNHRQLLLENDIKILFKSVPVTLRKITRDSIDIRSQHEKFTDSVNQQLNEMRVQLENATSSANHLLGRVEFVRRELMFEMRYGDKTPTSGDDYVKVRTEIVNPEKLAAALNERLRLNLGCGHIPLEGYLNVDRRALPGVDIIAEIDELPFQSGEVDEIFSAHVLEHFPQEQLRRKLLPYWVDLLKHGGVFRSVVPDAESMIKGYANGSFPYASLREVTFGAQDYDGDFHFNMFVAEQLEDLLIETGLTNVEWTAKGRKNGACFEMEFAAVK